jgi:hypothetical protein
MEQNVEHFENEINDLKAQLEHFEKEKERVRAIIGNIGGVPKFRTKLVNILFIIIIAAAGLASVLKDEWRLLMVELTTIMLSVKIIYMIHVQARVNHFKFWILSAIELRVIEMMDLIKQSKRQQ